MRQPHIQILLGDDSVPPALQSALHRTPATKSFAPLSSVLTRANPSPADAHVIVTRGDPDRAVAPIHRFLQRLADRPRAALVLSTDRNALRHITHPPTVPVTFAGEMGEEELFVRLRMMLEMRASLDSLHREMITKRRSEVSAARRYQHQLRVASQIQREFLPERLPRIGPLSFSALFRPIDFVSGDLYDIHPLDDEHVGIAVADASGHGIPAALLTVYIKRALRGRERNNGAYRILRPDEVLYRLNEELLEANLTECRFVAATYAVVNTRTLEVELARGGTPYPIIRRADGEIEMAHVEGPIVGVLDDANFQTAALQLEPGDSLLLATDGIERLSGATPTALLPERLSAARGRPQRKRSMARRSAANVAGVDLDSGGVAVLDAAVALTSSHVQSIDQAPAWLRTLAAAGASDAIEELEIRFDTLRRLHHPLDDLTVVAMHVEGAAQR